MNKLLQQRLGAYIRANPKESLATMGKRIGLTKAALSKLHSHGEGGGIRALIGVAKLIGVTPWDLLREALTGDVAPAVAPGNAEIAAQLRGLADAVAPPHLTLVSAGPYATPAAAKPARGRFDTDATEGAGTIHDYARSVRRACGLHERATAHRNRRR